jgi:hypothetical protein
MTMRIAAELLGGPRQLRIFLRAPAADVAAWLAATRDPPEPAFLRALELILDDLDVGGRRLAKTRRSRRQAAQILTPRTRRSPK